jgi:hypothetical protein
MKERIRKLPSTVFSLVLAFSMALGLMPGMCMTAYADHQYPLWVGGTQVTDSNCSDLETNHWSYSAETHTLTLKNFSVNQRGYQYGIQNAAAAIYYSGQDNLTISLIGTNRITMVPDCSSDCGIVSATADSTLFFSGTGSLTITSAGDGYHYFYDAAIYSSGSVVFNSGSFNVGDTNNPNYGIKSPSVTIGSGIPSFDAKGYSGAFSDLVQNAAIGIGYYNQGGKAKADVIDIHETPVSLKYTPLWGSPRAYQEVSFPRSQFTLEFTPNGGSGTMASLTVTEGETIKLPECGFDPPEKTQLFSRWDVTGVDLIGTPGTELLIARNCLLGGKITAEARWVESTEAMAVVKPEANDLTYNGALHELVTQGIPWRGTMLFVIGDSGEQAPDSGWSEDIPKRTEAGTYYVWFMVKSTQVGTADSKPLCVVAEIKKANAVAATVTANNRTYDGTEQALVSVDNTTLFGGTMYYAVTTGRTAPDKSSYTTFIPRATSAGTYYVWYKVVGDANHKDTEAAYVISKIAPITVPTSAPTSVPKTGDDSLPFLWFGMIILGAIGLGGLAVTKFRK